MPAVEAGLVPRIEPDADAIKAAMADPDHKFNDSHWLACGTALSGGKVKNLVEL